MDADAVVAENAKKDPGGGGGKKAGDQKGKESKKGGKAERQKGAPKAKEAQASWVKKDAEADGSAEEHKPQERKGRDKAKEKGGNWKEGRGEGKKESWKERRGKQHDRFDGDAGATGGNEAGGGGGRHRGHAGNSDANADSVLNGGALLSLLKANPPSVLRYTRDELLSIGQLPASKVKPTDMNEVIDKENSASPLIFSRRADKEDREARGARNRREVAEDEYDEDPDVGRRERRQRGRREEAEGADEEAEGAEERRRRGGRWGEERGSQRWKEDEEAQRRWAMQELRAGAALQDKEWAMQELRAGNAGIAPRGKGMGKAPQHYEDGGQWAMPEGKGNQWARPAGKDNQWAMPAGKDNQWAMPGKDSQWSMPGKDNQWAMPGTSSGGRGGADEWDMPDVNASQDMSLMDFTLGDIRQAERSFNKGMSMKDYKASLKADQHDRPSQPLAQVEEAKSGASGAGKERGGKERDGMFGGSSGFFVEEDEDVAQASRGFGKWFGRGADTGKGAGEGSDEDEDTWDMPQGQATGHMAQPRSMLPQDKSKPSPSASSQQPHRAEPRTPEAHPMAFSSIEKLLEESPGSNHEDDSSGGMLGKSVFSMMGRTEPGGDASLADGAAAMGLDPSKQGRLSVAELFHLAQGKELPSMPVMNSNQKEDGDESAEQKMQREVLKMTSHLMWMAAAKARPPGAPPGNRYGAAPPAGFGGMTHPGAQNPGMTMGRGSPQDQALYAEAYAQAMMAQGLGKGGGFPSMGGKGPKGGQASWQAQQAAAMGAAYQFPRGPSYGSQAYGGHPSHGGFDGSNGQGYNAQMAAMQGLYTGQVLEGPTKSSDSSSAEKGGGGRGAGHQVQAASWVDNGGTNAVGSTLPKAAAPSSPLSIGGISEPTLGLSSGTAGGLSSGTMGGFSGTTTGSATALDASGAKLPEDKPGQDEANDEEEAGCSQS